MRELGNRLELLRVISRRHRPSLFPELLDSTELAGAWARGAFLEPDDPEGSSPQLPRTLPSLFHSLSPEARCRIGDVPYLKGAIILHNAFQLPITDEIGQSLHPRRGSAGLVGQASLELMRASPGRFRSYSAASRRNSECSSLKIPKWISQQRGLHRADRLPRGEEMA